MTNWRGLLTSFGCGVVVVVVGSAVFGGVPTLIAWWIEASC